jgi:hypothetical protein
MSQNDMRGSGQAVRAGDDGRGLRQTSFAAVVMLAVQYILGMWVNLYATIPASDKGKGAFAAFVAAVADGPVGLALHALLGTVLLATALALVIRAVLASKAAMIGIGTVALLAILAAWLSGARFTADGSDGASFGMAIATGVALLCYVIILFAPSLSSDDSRNANSDQQGVY